MMMPINQINIDFQVMVLHEEPPQEQDTPETAADQISEEPAVENTNEGTTDEQPKVNLTFTLF